MADSKSEALTNLIQSIASATGWVQHVVELNTALQPFLAGGLNLDTIEADIDSAKQRLTGIGIQIRAAEDQLASVNERITLADDARKHQIDADFSAYSASIDSRKRQLDNCMEDLEFLSKRLQEEEKNKPMDERSMELIEKLRFVLENDFIRLPYTEAIEVLRNSNHYKKNKFQ